MILLGADGLIIEQTPRGSGAGESIAARVPGLATAAASFGRAAEAGDFGTAVLEFEQAVAIVASLPDDLLVVTTLRPGVGFAPFLRELRRERNRLVELL